MEARPRPAVQRKPLPKSPNLQAAASAPRQQHTPHLHVDTATTEKLGKLDLSDYGSYTANSREPFSPDAPTAWTPETGPPLPPRPPGQFALGITASPRQLTPTSTGLSTASTSTNGVASGTIATADPAADKPKEASFWKTALDETRFFAGGLIHKPYESTRHYTILRHSAGLVMYRGPTTNVVVTLFSTADRPIPADRTVWLQRRGFSGDTGLRLKTLVGASGSWIDVTPDRQAQAAELPTADERGYQRDMAKMAKKATPSSKHFEKALQGRQPRETLVVRIPAACNDGYFRLVVCTGGTGAGGAAGASAPTKRKVLCGSPVFRVASTSTDASIFRGASLRTLPMEAGVKIASLIGTTYVANAAAPIVSTVQDTAAKYQPGTVGTMAAETAYSNSKISSKVGEAGESYEEARAAAYRAYHGVGGGGGGTDAGTDNEAPPEVVGADSGPEKPFPIQFQGRVVAGTGRSTAELGVPTANLADVPDDVRMRMRGVYFGWAMLKAKAKADSAGPRREDPEESKESKDIGIPSDWIEVMVTVGPQWQTASMPTSVVRRNDVVAHLLYDFGDVSLVGCRMELILMGSLRHLSSSGQGGTGADTDALVVVTSLSRPRWGPQATLSRIETEKSGRTLSDKYVDTRGKIQKHVDRIPVHWAGVRTSGGEMRDQLYGNGGFWIAR